MELKQRLRDYLAVRHRHEEESEAEAGAPQGETVARDSEDSEASDVARFSRRRDRSAPVELEAWRRAVPEREVRVADAPLAEESPDEAPDRDLSEAEPSAPAKPRDVWRVTGRAVVVVGLVVLSIAAGWLALEGRRTQEALAVERLASAARHLALEQEIDAVRSRNAALLEEVEAERATRRAAEARAPGSARAPLVAAFLFEGGSLPSGGSDERLAIPAAAEVLAFQVPLATRPSPAGLRVRITTRGGGVVWSEAVGRMAVSAGSPRLDIRVPAALLLPGAYALIVRSGQAGSGEVLASHTFEVIRR